MTIKETLRKVDLRNKKFSRAIRVESVLSGLLFGAAIYFSPFLVSTPKTQQVQAQESNDSRPLTTPQFYLRELRKLRRDNNYEIVVSEPRGYNGFLHYFSNNVPQGEEDDIVVYAFCPTDLNFPDPNRNDADYRLSVMESAGCSPETREIKLPVERVLLTLHIEGAEKRTP